MDLNKLKIRAYRTKKFIKASLKEKINYIKYRHTQKIFCIGLNKTGTTSFSKAMEELGFKVGNQREAEKLFDDWVKRDFSKLTKYCKKAEFFQDVPFSLPYTFIAMDQAFPGSKFILTIRDDAEQWYNSLTKAHAKKWGKNNRIPTAEDLKNATYINKGHPWHTRIHIHPVTEKNPYEKKILLDYYQTHNKNVKDYFRHRPEDLLILNVAEKGAYQKLAHFLDINTDKKDFPWENKTFISSE
jgi:hypothetical protein